jgi:hypothetical protein
MAVRWNVRLALILGASAMLFCTGRACAGLEFAHTTVSVGEVRCGAPLAHRFLFVNRGTTDVEIVDMKTACGCLTPTLSKKSLKPGEEASLLLEVNTLTQAAGPQDWWIKLLYRADERVEEVTLSITGKLVEEIRVEPPTLAIYADQAIEHALTVVDTRAQSLSVKAVSASSPNLRASIGTSAKNEKGEWTIPIQLSFNGTTLDGQHQETINIVTDDPSYPELHVRVLLIKEEHNKITVSPTLVSIRALEGRPLPSRILAIRTSGDEPVEVEGVTTDDPAIQCTWAPGPDNNATLKVTVDRQRFKGDHLFGKVQIKLRRPTMQTLTVPVECLSD